MPVSAPESPTVDRLDRRLIHALTLDGRLPFRRIADVLGSSEQTVARRYRRLREAGVLRVVVLRDPRRYRENLFVRVRTKPGAGAAIGAALARREDVSWVGLTAGGTEVNCALRSDDPHVRDALVLEGLPRLGHVLDVSTSVLLHTFAGDAREEWHALEDRLTPAEVAGLLPDGPRPRVSDVGTDADALTPEDGALLGLLAVDGRSSYAALAAATGRSEGVVARRVDALFARGTLFVDLELAPSALGFGLHAMLWAVVAPSELDRVGHAVSRAPEVAFAGAFTGTANLAAAVTCRDTAELYRLLTTTFAADAFRQLEVVPLARWLKRAGTVMDGDRLPDPLSG